MGYCKYTYRDIIPYIAAQLEFYYNTDPYVGDIADIVGCSKTTATKYENSSIVYTDGKRYRLINAELNAQLKNLPFPNNQIKTPHDDEEDFIWIAGENGIYQKKKEQPIPAPFTDLTSFNIKLKYSNSTFDYPTKSGLYMLAQTVCVPTRINERHFLIKIGMSETNLNNRINSYKGVNPFAICIDTIVLPKDEVRDEERDWHNKMGKLYEPVITPEWFNVPFEDYVRFLEFGFNTNI